MDKQLDSSLEAKKITKYCYNVFVKEYCTSVSDTNLKDKWQHSIQVNLDNLQAWNLRFALIYKSSIDNTIRNFQFKFLYRKISTNEFLLYPPAGTAGGYFGFSSVMPRPPRHILVCALTAAFLDGFLSNFVWRCILVKSTHLLFLVMLPPVFRLL